MERRSQERVSTLLAQRLQQGHRGPKRHREAQMTQTTIGELINTVYESCMELYGDEELASVATAAVVNDLLTARPNAQMEAAA